MNDLWEKIKQHPLWIAGGALVLILVYYYFSSSSSSTGTTGAASTTASSALTSAELNANTQLQLAQIQAGVQGQGISASLEASTQSNRVQQNLGLASIQSGQDIAALQAAENTSIAKMSTEANIAAENIASSTQKFVTQSQNATMQSISNIQSQEAVQLADINAGSGINGIFTGIGGLIGKFGNIL